ncbi:MAG: response regulator [Phormidesmis sp.]
MSDPAMSDSIAPMPYRVFNRLFENLQAGGSGMLRMSSQSQQWHFYLLDGELLYVWGDRLPVRRFRRVARHYRPNWQWRVHSDWLGQKFCWEMHLIEQAIADNILSPIQLKLMLRMILQECSVELLHNRIVDNEWQPLTLEASSTYRAASLSETEIRGVFRKASHIHKNWQISRLRSFKLDAVPVVAEGGDPGILPELENCLDGETTLWDILLSQEPSMAKLASVLGPLIEDDAIAIKPISDLPLPMEGQSLELSDEPALLEDSLAGEGSEVSSTVSTAVAAPSGDGRANDGQANDEPALIACIDDSPVLTLSLTKILTEAGYRTLSIPEPMRGFAELIEQRPNLILLDLMLPNADGYSICKFLRETAVFAKTPIIILTGQDSKIDRMRAQLVGATDFLSKPPQADALVQLIEQTLAEGKENG